MKPFQEFQDPVRTRELADRLARRVQESGRGFTVMEVCGTHTHAIAAAGLRKLCPKGVRIISGPGCPVCVTPVDYMDHAVALARRPGTTLCTFGDLLRVPSSHSSLERERAQGADVRIVYSARDALDVARALPDREVVFLGVGFETTLPTIAATLLEAEMEGPRNFSVWMGAKLIEPPLRALLEDGEVAVDAFLLPGHVSVILGSDFYSFLVDEYRVPCAIAGFAPVDVMLALNEIADQRARGIARVANLYPRAVTERGNATAQELLHRVFEPVDTRWRGLGSIPASGLALRKEFAHRDAARFPVDPGESVEPRGCRCGEVLKGTIDPPECPLFARVCTPENPVGSCMVSSEGTCAAWKRYGELAMGVAR
ncbi:MAG: hydrogenase formation protein HypD [Planctomycetes bacterium]|nr:hydrogenase formation protein HypD [Planctomycetota bacterium]